MQLLVRVFGILMAAVDDPEGLLELEVPQGASVAEVIALLAERSPLFDARSCLAVVDGAQVPFSHRLQEGQELHLHHTFSGG